MENPINLGENENLRNKDADANLEIVANNAKNNGNEHIKEQLESDNSDTETWHHPTQNVVVGGGAVSGGGGGVGEKLNNLNLTSTAPPNFQNRPTRNTNPFNRSIGDGSSNWQNPNTIASAATTQLELWVEARAEDGKSYYYHAITRETTWNKPVGQNIKVMTQVEIEEMNKKQQIQQAPTLGPTTVGVAKPIGIIKPSEKHLNDGPMCGIVPEGITSQPPPNMLSQPPPTQQTMSQPPPNVAASGIPPPMTQQPPPFFQPGMHHHHPPPNFQQPPFGMPPGYGGFPGGPPHWNMPWNQQHSMPPPVQQEKPAKNLILKPGVIDPAVIARAAEWSEHRAPDGRPYYYHAGRGESVWEKPQALRDMEAARMAAHSGATPQQAVATAATTSLPPHLMPNALMHMPPGGFDPSLAYNVAAAAAAAASIKATERAKPAPQTMAAGQEKDPKKFADDKLKKDEEQKKGGTGTSPTKPVDKSRPISSTPIAGTPWCVVWTGDARVFFYNPSTRTSVWERPEDLLDRADVDKAVLNTPEQLKSLMPKSASEKQPEQEADKTENTNAVAENNDKTVKEQHQNQKQQQVEENGEDDEVIKIRTESDSSVEEIPTKKLKIATKLSKKADANEAVVEAEVRAAKERAIVPLETRIKQFKEMLREKDVSAFSTWEKELHKIVFDPRYLLLTSKERKQVFEKYVKDRAEEERKEKRNKMRQKRDDFRKLMEDVKLHGKSSFSEFSQKHGKDDRYKAIEKVRERESLFNEYIVDVRRREKEDRIQKKEQIRKDFLEMLRDRSDIDRHTRWHDIKKKFENDSRYRAVDNSLLREEYFMDYMRQLKDEKRRQREREDREKERQREKDRDRDRERRDRDRERKSDKKSDRGRERSRSRDRKVKDSKDKEKERDKDKDAENKNGENKKKRVDSDDGEHQDEENHHNSGDDEAERLQKEREKQLRAEMSIREREKEVQRTLAGHLRDRDKEREHHKRDEAIGHFNALLVDLVRNPDLTWKEVKRQLRKDHRWEMIETLDRDDREKIFNDHIDGLMKKKREKFREMLDELSTLELTSSWKDIKKLIKEDPRYLKYNSSDKCEREFRDYIKDKTMNAKASLRELLQECKLVNHKTRDLINDNPNHLKEIEDILKNDKRYLILEHMSEERTTIVLNYLEELHKRGPPPPPTASESTRRNK